MHIPQGASQTIDILPFAEALALSGRGDEYDSRKWLYVPDFYTEYRYILGTRGQNPLICIGVNPSTAAPDDLDNTLKSVSRIAEGNGFDSWIMFNVYAQRATRPEDMDRELNQALHRANMAAFEYILQQVGQGLGQAGNAAGVNVIGFQEQAEPQGENGASSCRQDDPVDFLPNSFHSFLRHSLELYFKLMLLLLHVLGL